MKFGRFKDKNGNNAINYNQLEIQYPVNKVEIFYDDDDHSNWLGFTWELVSKGRTPVGLNVNDIDFNTIGKQGGSKTHKHTLNSAGAAIAMVSSATHVQIKQMPNIINYSRNISINSSTASAQTSLATALVGTTDDSNNQSPYEVVAYWRRIA